MDSLKHLFETGEYSDITVSCGKRQWKLHVAHLCYRSRYFKSQTKDRDKTRKPTIKLTDEDPDAVGEMLRFIYTLDYGYKEHNDVRAMTDLRVHMLAEKYDIPDLAQFSETRFAENVRSVWKRAAFVNLIEVVYTRATDRDGKLSAAVLDVAIFHASVLYEADFGAEFRRMTKLLPAFSSDMNARLVFMLERVPVQPFLLMYKCGCGQSWVQTARKEAREGHESQFCRICFALVEAEFPAHVVRAAAEVDD